MKCLLCSSVFGNEQELMQHYISNHNVDQSNWFFQKLFHPKEKAVFKQCQRCTDFLTTGHHKVRHDFLKHYDQGQQVPFENKLLDISRFSRLTIYSIEYQKCNYYYNFSFPEKVVDDFLRNVKYKFKLSGRKWIKCSFTIENIQQLPNQDLRPILNSRYWTTDAYEGVYFNDFIFYGLRQNIFSKVILNVMTGGSWSFRNFISLFMNILDLDAETLTQC